MKKSLCLFLASLLLAGAASASDVVQNGEHKHVLKTSKNAQCSTPSAKASKECAHGAGTQGQNTPAIRTRVF